MKFLLIGLLLAGSAWSQDYRFSDSATEEQKVLFESMQRPWGESGDIGKSFDQLEAILKNDKPSMELIAEANEALAARGLGTIKNIMSFCPEGNSGYFSQGSEMIEMKEDGEVWSAEAIEKMKQAYSTRIIKLPFFEIMVGSENPAICINKDETVQSVVDVFNHELTHFMKGDTFGMIETILKMEDLSEYYEHHMAGNGGEMDGYKAGIGAEARVLSSLGIANPAERYGAFLDNDGVVTDDVKLRKYLDELYFDYYHQREQVNSVLESAISFSEYRIQRLQDNVGAEDEIARLKRIVEKLRTQMK